MRDSIRVPHGIIGKARTKVPGTGMITITMTAIEGTTGTAIITGIILDMDTGIILAMDMDITLGMGITLGMVTPIRTPMPP